MDSVDVSLGQLDAQSVWHSFYVSHSVDSYYRENVGSLVEEICKGLYADISRQPLKVSTVLAHNSLKRRLLLRRNLLQNV